MIVAVEHWPLALGATLTAAAGLWLVLRWRARPDARLADDARDPYRRWVQNAFLLVTGDCDYAHLPGSEARRMLAHWWDVYGPVELQRTLARLARQIPYTAAMEIILGGEPVSADFALRCGLVTRVVPHADTLSVATEWAHKVAEAAPLALALAKQVVVRTSGIPLAEAYAGARTLRLADGPDEVHLGLVARDELGRAGLSRQQLPQLLVQEHADDLAH